MKLAAPARLIHPGQIEIENFVTVRGQPVGNLVPVGEEIKNAAFAGDKNQGRVREQAIGFQLLHLNEAGPAPIVKAESEDDNEAREKSPKHTKSKCPVSRSDPGIHDRMFG